MVTVTTGSIVRILSSDKKIDVWTKLSADVDVEDSCWDSEKLTLMMDHLVDFEPFTMTWYVGTDRGKTIYLPSLEPKVMQAVGVNRGPSNFKPITVTSMIVPVKGYDNMDPICDGDVYNGVIMVNSVPYPVPTNKNIVTPFYTEYIGIKMAIQSYGVTLTVTSVDQIPDIIRMSDLGQVKIHLIVLSMPIYEAYMVSRNTDFVHRFADVLHLSLKVVNDLREIKSEANGLLDSTENIDHIYRLQQTCPIHMSWFFTPDGYYHYGRDMGYQWVFKMSDLKLGYKPRLAKIIESMINRVTDIHIPLSSPYDLQYKYCEPSHIKPRKPLYRADNVSKEIKDALRDINRDSTKVVLSGGFSISDREYTFYILNGDLDTGKRFMNMMGTISYTVPLHNKYVAIDGRNKYVFAKNMTSILDVLYAQSMSHMMVAYDGTNYYVTPEYATFTSANLSLMVKPFLLDTVVQELKDAGMPIVYHHLTYVSLSRKIEMATDDTIVPSDMNVIYGEYLPIYSTTASVEEVCSVSNDLNIVSNVYLDANGINMGCSITEKGKMYYQVKFIRNERNNSHTTFAIPDERVNLIREIATSNNVGVYTRSSV